MPVLGIYGIPVEIVQGGGEISQSAALVSVKTCWAWIWHPQLLLCKNFWKQAKPCALIT